MELEICVNGAARAVREGCTVAQLVAELGLRPEVVAVERNGRIVRRALHAETVLCAGDALEVVTLVGGG